MAQEIRAQTAMLNRRPATDPAALYLMQARLPKLKISPAKRRLKIAIDADSAQIEHPVKIRHAG